MQPIFVSGIQRNLWYSRKYIHVIKAHKKLKIQKFVCYVMLFSEAKGIKCQKIHGHTCICCRDIEQLTKEHRDL